MADGPHSRACGPIRHEHGGACHSNCPTCGGKGAEIAQERDRLILEETLVYHSRNGITGCTCGWAELGRSWPEHVANVYFQAREVQ